MHTSLARRAAIALLAALALAGCHDQGTDPVAGAPRLAQGPPDGGEETAGNNLSFPVIWAEGVSKVLPGQPGMTPTLTGAWWYWWGTTIDGDPLACAPDPQDMERCDDGNPVTATGPAPAVGAERAYIQKDALNVWQAGAVSGVGAEVVVDSIDWGDNLESVPWYLTSQVRLETVLYKLVDPAMLEYQMRHLYGLGMGEIWGVSTAPDAVGPLAQLGPGTRATVFSPCARLTIQKLAFPREDTRLAALVWDPAAGAWTEPEGSPTALVNDPIFNQAVYQAADGPGYYNAEINVKGMIIYGYTWGVRKLNDGAGDYRVTFSLGTCGATTLNTFFRGGVTGIMAPEEEGEVVPAAEPVGGGATGVLDVANNLTYLDVRILGNRGGGGRGGGGGPGGPR